MATQAVRRSLIEKGGLKAGDMREGARAAAQLMGDIRRECDSLGAFQRQWYKLMLKQRTGLSLEDWESTSLDISILAADPAGGAHAMAAHVAQLKLLAGYFGKLEAEVRGFMKDPRQLEQALSTLEHRRVAAENAAVALMPGSSG